MPSDTFFVYAERMGAYKGVLYAQMQIDAQQAGVAAPPQQAAATPKQRYRPHDVIERADDGTKILNGVAVDEEDIPLWTKKLPGAQGKVEVIPGDIGSIGFSEAFRGQFSYARVSKQEQEAVGD